MIMALLKLIALSVSLLPLNWALKLGDLLGLMFYHLFPSRRRIALDNLRQAFTHRVYTERSECARRSPALIARLMARNMGKSAVEFLRLPALTAQTMDGYIRWVGLEHLEDALRHNKGVFLLTAHIGNWDLFASAYSLKGYNIHLITKHLKIGFLNRFWMDTRSRMNITQHYREGSIKEIINTLRRNELMGFILDQHTHSKDGVLVDFFGRPAWTLPGLAVLAQRLKSPVLPTFLIRQPDGTHKAFIEPAIPFVEKETQKETIRYNTQTYTNVLEKYISQYPDQWIWMHRRWRV
ncbi:MAG: lysophospholipid acyltransferase family protein [Planctomycetota bacterium]